MATTTPTRTARPVPGSRLRRIVVRRAGALAAVATPSAPGACAEDRRAEPVRAADLVWRLPGAAPLAAGC